MSAANRSCSGTFREAAALSNSDHTPKLPDWAIVDLRTPPGPKWPGKIVDAGFFDENWKWPGLFRVDSEP